MSRWIVIALILLFVIALPFLFIESALYARVTAVIGVCLVLWLSEIVPPFVPTLLLWTLAPLFLVPLSDKFVLSNVLTWAIDPVLALFLGGFVLGAATQRYNLDKRLTQITLRSAGHSFKKFLFLIILLTAFLSMWMSNIAAAALMLTCLHPVVSDLESDNSLRRALLIGVALGANLGGISTPIGTGPNAIAIASMDPAQRVSFLGWMSFALPLAVGMLIAGFLLILLRVKRKKNDWTDELRHLSGIVLDDSEPKKSKIHERGFVLVLLATIGLWLTEPLHGVSAAIISLAATTVIFLTGILEKEDLRRIDWSTLFLIAGGITLGRLLEQSELIKSIAAAIPFSELHPTLGLFLLCLICAILAALMSNTATVVMIIPLAQAFIPEPSTAILVAISASFGIPFVISTPPNAMVYGEGGLRFNDLFLPGLILMLAGCLLISLTGDFVLKTIGIP